VVCVSGGMRVSVGVLGDVDNDFCLPGSDVRRRT